MADKILYTHEYIIDQFSYKEMKALAIYYFAKRKCVNSTIYNWSYKRIADYLGISKHQANKYIKILRDKGFVYEHEGNLVFKSMYKVLNDCVDKKQQRGSKSINITRKDSIQDITDKLFTIRIAEQISRQQYIIKLKSDIKFLDKKVDYVSEYRGESKRIKKLIKQRNKYPELTEKVEDYNIVNCRKLAKDLKISMSTSSRLLKRIESKDYVVRKKIVEKASYTKQDGYRRCGYIYTCDNIQWNCIGTDTKIQYNTIYHTLYSSLDRLPLS